MIALEIPVIIVKIVANISLFITIYATWIFGTTPRFAVYLFWPFNDQWLLLLKEYDFSLDGFLILRLSDITSVKCTATNAFQRALMKDEGVFMEVDLSQSFENLAFEDYIQTSSLGTIS